MATSDEGQSLTKLRSPIPGVISLHEALAAYEKVTSQFGFSSIIDPGRIQILGWDLEFVCGAALASFIDQILVRRLNDFIALHEDPFILDCGANIGFTVLNYKRQYPKARIMAFEPDPNFASVLRRNLERNGAMDVEVVEAAVWMRQGQVRWFCEGIDGSKIVERWQKKTTDTIGVASVDLGQFLNKPVDLLKLDIEGAEYAVVMNLGREIRNIRNILIECHLDQSNFNDFGKMLKFLVSRGFKLSINTFGPWRDLIRQPAVAPNHWEQYLLVAGWHGEVPEVDSGDPMLPYLGAQKTLELRNLHAETASLRRGLDSTGFFLESLANDCEKSKRRQIEKPFVTEGVFCWRAMLPGLEYCADDSQHPMRSRLLLMEDSKMLGPPHALHADVRSNGGGLYSHWGSNLYFSTPDNTDPNTNGRMYWAVILEAADLPS